MQFVTLYFATAIVFLAIDVVMLKMVLKPLFEKHLGDWMLDDPRMGAAAMFYLFYIVGVVILVSLPALQSGGWLKAMWMGALLGAVAYGTYEFTNYATLSRWSLQMVIIDWIWGAVLTGVSAASGVAIAQAFFTR